LVCPLHVYRTSALSNRYTSTALLPFQTAAAAFTATAAAATLDRSSADTADVAAWISDATAVARAAAAARGIPLPPAAVASSCFQVLAVFNNSPLGARDEGMRIDSVVWLLDGRISAREVRRAVGRLINQGNLYSTLGDNIHYKSKEWAFHMAAASLADEALLILNSSPLAASEEGMHVDAVVRQLVGRFTAAQISGAVEDLYECGYIYSVGNDRYRPMPPV
jgi:hypothetical protein